MPSARTGTLSLHDALPILAGGEVAAVLSRRTTIVRRDANTYTFADQVLATNVDVVAVVHALDRPFKPRSEEHTPELQSLAYLVCRLLLAQHKQPSAPFLH